jgi:uncharacterized protein YijF (DUF1287 family)
MRLRSAAGLAALVAVLAPGAAAADPASEEARSALTRRLVAAALDRAKVKVRYDGAYVAIPYPGGDVPADTGVCADEIIRIYRAVGIDLQREVHEDMAQARAAYPRRAARLDPNIDHRRVTNLRVFFGRRGEALPISPRGADYRPGDLVVWDLVAGHIGMVVDRRDPSGARPLVLHNVGRGPMIEDALFSWPVIGHYRYPAR